MLKVLINKSTFMLETSYP